MTEVIVEKHTEKKLPWLWIGLTLTALVVISAFLVGRSEICAWGGVNSSGCMSRWSYFLNSPPNEIGDTLAGFAGALAFVWLIVTVGLQSQELKAQRQELKLAREEYAKMSEAQEKQVEVLEKQREIFGEEQRQRDEAQAEAVLHEICRDIFFKVDCLSGNLWFEDAQMLRESKIGLRIERNDEDEWDKQLRVICTAYHAVDRLQWRCRDGSLYPDMPLPLEVIELREKLEALKSIAPRLSESMRYKFERLETDLLLERVVMLQTDEVFWRQRQADGGNQ